MDSIEKLLDYYNRSSEEEMYHNVVGHMMKNIDKIGKVSIYDMAELCYSSTSTISRVIKKVGFQNYAEFKTQIEYALKNYKYLNRHTRDVQVADEADIVSLYFNFLTNNIDALRDNIDYKKIALISDCFAQSEDIMIYSYPEVQAQILQKALIVTHKRAEVHNTIAGQKESVKNIKPGTVVLAIIPYLLELNEMRSVLKLAKQSGAYVISICSALNNDYEKYSDIQINFEGTKTSMDLYLFMIINNLIKYDYGNRYVEKVMEDLYV